MKTFVLKMLRLRIPRPAFSGTAGLASDIHVSKMPYHLGFLKLAAGRFNP
jgi:hypothetical protein